MLLEPWEGVLMDENLAKYSGLTAETEAVYICPASENKAIVGSSRFMIR
jgi:hypothetical protein